MKTARKRKTSKSSRKTARRAAPARETNTGSASGRGRGRLGRAYEWAQEAASGSRLRNLRLPRRSDIGELTEANPLILGAIGLGLGVAIGTLFPRHTGGLGTLIPGRGHGLLSTGRRSSTQRGESAMSRQQRSDKSRQRRTKNGGMAMPDSPLGE